MKTMTQAGNMVDDNKAMSAVNESPVSLKKSRWPSRKYIVGALVAVVFLLVVGAWVLYKSSVKSATKYVRHYSSTNLVTYKVDYSSGKGGSFLMPTNFFANQSNLLSHEATVGLTAFKREGNKAIVVAQINFSSYPKYGLSAAEVGKTLSSPGNSDFDSLLIPIGGSILGGLSSGNYSFSYSSAKPFTSSHVSKDAWRLDFTASPRTNSQVHKYKGSILVVYGQNANYFFAVDSLDYNWQPNMDAWQKVLDSLTVDQ